MNEYKKYIVEYSFVSFLGFSEKFTQRFNKFTYFITLVIKFMCIFHILQDFTKASLLIINIFYKIPDEYFQLFKFLTYIF